MLRPATDPRLQRVNISLSVNRMPLTTLKWTGISSLSATREPEFGSLWALEGTEVRWIPNASGQSTQKQIKDANRSEIEFLNLALQSSMKQLNAGDNYLHCIVKGRLLSIELGIVSLSIQCEQVV